jgi:hypothetical protein
MPTQAVIPAQAGIQHLGPRLRGGDKPRAGRQVTPENDKST